MRCATPFRVEHEAIVKRMPIAHNGWGSRDGCDASLYRSRQSQIVYMWFTCKCKKTKHSSLVLSSTDKRTASAVVYRGEGEVTKRSVSQLRWCIGQRRRARPSSAAIGVLKKGRRATLKCLENGRHALLYVISKRRTNNLSCGGLCAKKEKV